MTASTGLTDKDYMQLAGYAFSGSLVIASFLAVLACEDMERENLENIFFA